MIPPKQAVMAAQTDLVTFGQPYKWRAPRVPQPNVVGGVLGALGIKRNFFPIFPILLLVFPSIFYCLPSDFCPVQRIVPEPGPLAVLDHINRNDHACIMVVFGNGNGWHQAAR